MRVFNYNEVGDKLSTAEIVTFLTQINVYKAKQDLFASEKPDVLKKLVEIAKIQSIDASNRIEGIYTSNERLKKLVKDKVLPQNRGETEIAGYRDVLTTINESYNYISIKSGTILQLHRDLYKYSDKSFGGKFKTSNNIIEEIDASGNRCVRFYPVEAWQTMEAIEKICDSFDKAAACEQIDALLAIPIFILDFLCIHPFNDGNGRMSRLLTLFLLYRAGYLVGKYISIKNLIEKSKETYYEVLRQSSQNWHDGSNDYHPFVKYTLGVVLAVYRDFFSRIDVFVRHPKSDRIREVIKEKLGKITKSEIIEKCGDVSRATIQRSLNELKKRRHYKNWRWL